MCITEEKLVEAYGNSNPHERFLLSYKNYSVFPQLVDCYETGLFNRILFEVEYNRRKKNDDDLGVRVQTSHRSDPTASKAIEHIMIRDAIEECNFSGNILKETDTPEKHKIHSFMDLAKEAKAVYRIRRIVLVNTEIIEEYLENFRDI